MSATHARSQTRRSQDYQASGHALVLTEARERAAGGSLSLAGVAGTTGRATDLNVELGFQRVDAALKVVSHIHVLTIAK
jgi:hypothetical protein